jgi:hypothetical protein
MILGGATLAGAYDRVGSLHEYAYISQVPIFIAGPSSSSSTFHATTMRCVCRQSVATRAISERVKRVLLPCLSLRRFQHTSKASLDDKSGHLEVALQKMLGFDVLHKQIQHLADTVATREDLEAYITGDTCHEVPKECPLCSVKDTCGEPTIAVANRAATEQKPQKTLK